MQSKRFPHREPFLCFGRRGTDDGLLHTLLKPDMILRKRLNLGQILYRPDAGEIIGQKEKTVKDTQCSFSFILASHHDFRYNCIQNTAYSTQYTFALVRNTFPAGPECRQTDIRKSRYRIIFPKDGKERRSYEANHSESICED